ncbi:hypothetical protein VTO73DRAFT_8144 [Trametes versicolor]
MLNPRRCVPSELSYCWSSGALMQCMASGAAARRAQLPPRDPSQSKARAVRAWTDVLPRRLICLMPNVHRRRDRNYHSGMPSRSSELSENSISSLQDNSKRQLTTVLSGARIPIKLVVPPRPVPPQETR